ncbi:MAG: hypothetical protein SVJ22_11090, partial [Halobacteriota archaeon]|nr:hypothetical protein [Halobacteriota archaeon]
NAEYEFHGIDFRSYVMGSTQKTDDSIVKYLIRERHSEDLKNVIKCWIEEFPEVSAAYYPPERFWIPSKGVDGKIRIERDEEFLFKDLRLHLDLRDDKIFKLWDEFKEKRAKHRDKVEALKSEILKDIADKVNKAVSEEINDIKLEISVLHGTNIIYETFVVRIYNACLSWAEGDFNTFMKHYQNAKSKVRLTDDTWEYHIDGDECIKLEKDLIKVADLQLKIDSVMNEMVKKAKSGYYSKGKEIIDLTKELIELGDKTKRLLKKQLSCVVFDGDCEYLQ